MRVRTCVILLVALFASNLSAGGDVIMLKLDVAKMEMAGILDVRISNQSDKPLRIWKETNSWGAARWKVLRLRNGMLSFLYQDPDQEFTRNIPAATEVAAGGSTSVRLSLRSAEWRGQNGQEFSVRCGDTLVVVYDVPATREAREMGVWYGMAAASYEITSDLSP